MSIKDNLLILRQRISRAGADPDKIKIVAAVKTLATEKVLEALDAGITDIGDNRVQEALEKKDAIRAKYPKVVWHMIGHLQRNKVRHCLDTFDIIQTVDTEKLGLEIDQKAVRPIPVLIEVNTSQEPNKFGVPLGQAQALIEKLAALKNLRIRGLMTVGILSADQEKVRACFRNLKDLSEKIKILNLPEVEMKYLSMGMTDDLEIALQEGSNMLRIGRLIFGKREG